MCRRFLCYKKNMREKGTNFQTFPAWSFLFVLFFLKDEHWDALPSSNSRKGRFIVSSLAVWKTRQRGIVEWLWRLGGSSRWRRYFCEQWSFHPGWLGYTICIYILCIYIIYIYRGWQTYPAKLGWNNSICKSYLAGGFEYFCHFHPEPWGNDPILPLFFG